MTRRRALPAGFSTPPSDGFNCCFKDNSACVYCWWKITLSAREFALLHDLHSHKNRIRARSELEESLYAWGEEVESNAVEVYIHHLRKKFGAEFIRTVRGLGYCVGETG